jgi:hypothetical protein
MFLAIPDECARIDPNPILDSGASHTIGDITAAAVLANAIGLCFELNAPTGYLLNISWGPGSLDPQPIVASWTLQTQDINGVEVSFVFHLASQDIPLLIGTFFGTLSSISIITLPGLISGTATQSFDSPYIHMDNVLVLKSLLFIIQTSCQIAFS